jgi:uncharacterized membrane protein
MNKRISILLSLSLLVNVFCAGVVVSFYTMKEPRPIMMPPPHAMGPFSQFDRAKEFVSVEGVVLIDGVLQKYGVNAMDDVHSIMEYREKARVILLGDKLDTDALQVAHDKMEEHEIIIKKHLSQIIYEISVVLSDEDRIAFFTEALPNKHPRHRDRGPRQPR